MMQGISLEKGGLQALSRRPACIEAAGRRVRGDFTISVCLEPKTETRVPVWGSKQLLGLVGLGSGKTFQNLEHLQRGCRVQGSQLPEDRQEHGFERRGSRVSSAMRSVFNTIAYDSRWFANLQPKFASSRF